MKTHRTAVIQRVIIMTLATTFLALVTIGCNTARGFGKDVERTGEKIQEGTR